MPKQDIESLGVMGWGLDAARKFFRRRRRRRTTLKSENPKSSYFCSKSPIFRGHTVRNANKTRKIQISDLDFRIAWIDPFKLVWTNHGKKVRMN